MFGMLFGILICGFIAGNYILTLRGILNGAALISDYIFIYEAAGAIVGAVLGAASDWFGEGQIKNTVIFAFLLSFVGALFAISKDLDEARKREADRSPSENCSV
ncbi:hypothetical protein AGMMS50293_31450 [Spirochaetia bacterium]|nr:hypothetical protein AGMMS50293_31450 [Spirochaetia bacterium]GHV04764.1 hypothetical protein AGMMS50229_06760 [Campylobacterota bacterium]